MSTPKQTGNWMAWRFGRVWSRGLVIAAIAATSLLGGCVSGPRILPENQRKTIDRNITEYPEGFELKPYMVDLNTPTGFCWDEDGTLWIAEGGIDGADPRIYGIRSDNTRVDIYPFGARIPLLSPGFRIYGPVGGIAAFNGRIYVSHRDNEDMGVITAFGYDGSHATIVGGLPARGDYGVTDIAISHLDGRLYFGLGTTTNSGVVGLDNWEEGWVQRNPGAHDIPYKDLVLQGWRFSTKNPNASIFSPADKITVPFYPFGVSYYTQVQHARFDRPTGAIFSVSPDGGGLKVEAWGVHNPVGLAINPDYNQLYFTDQGMEPRGTRPVYHDRDGLFKLYRDTWYGWPDFTRTFEPISDPKFQPPESLIATMVRPTGYLQLGTVIDHRASGLSDPDRQQWRANFEPLSGASKIAIIPDVPGPFKGHAGDFIVALWGDRSPFATSGQPLKPLPGYKLVRVDRASGEVRDFIFNTAGGPASNLKQGGSQGIERPMDAKFGPDGNLYILDFGRMRMRGGEEKTSDGSGKIFMLAPTGPDAPPATKP